jgi:hypothetical protein
MLHTDVGYVDVVSVGNPHSHIGIGQCWAPVSWTQLSAFAKLKVTPYESHYTMEDTNQKNAEFLGSL